jgi:hypothetical protein
MMSATTHPLDILFLTNFSDHCFRVIPSIAQMADSLPVRLTMMYAYDPTCTTARSAGETLESFFPEADRYRSCRRVVVPGPLVDAVQRHLRVWPAHLVIAPASDPIGLPRLGDRSLRSQLIEACGVPLWTIGRGIRAPKLLQPVKNVACWLDYRTEEHPHLAYAIEYAQRLGAALHVLQGIPIVEEGQVIAPGHPDKPLHADTLTETIAAACAGAPMQPHIHVAYGEGRRTIARLLEQCDADVVFLANEERLLSRWLGLNLGLRVGDVAPCPAIYISAKSNVPVWNLEPVRRPRMRAANESFALPGHLAFGEGRRAVAAGVLSELGLASGQLIDG